MKSILIELFLTDKIYRNTEQKLFLSIYVTKNF